MTAAVPRRGWVGCKIDTALNWYGFFSCVFLKNIIFATVNKEEIKREKGQK
jgi:hypothetical protein